MRVPRLYTAEQLQPGQSLQLDRDASRYLLQVLRLKPGRELLLFNGDGNDYRAVLSDAGKQATVAIESAEPNNSESPLQITLVQAISKGDRMDYTLQKSVELGVSRVQPVFSERSVVKLDASRLEKKTQHWRGVVQSACEQCGRSRVPEVMPALSLSTWLRESFPVNGGLLLSPYGERGIGDAEPSESGFTLLIGPEGGLDDAEIAAAREAGFSEVCMGPRVLRTETAAVAALAVLQARFGDLN